MSRRTPWSAARTLLPVALAIIVGTGGCGSSTPAAQSPKQQVEAATTALFAALKQGDYGAACNLYTAAVQKVILTGWQRLSHKPSTDCATALAGILAISPGVKGELKSLSAPKFDAVTVSGSHARVTVTLKLTHIHARNSFTLVREGSAWKIGKATGLAL